MFFVFVFILWAEVACLSIRRVKAGKNNCSNASPSCLYGVELEITCAYQYKCEGEISIQRLAMDVKNKLGGEVAESRTSINISENT